MPHIHEKIDLTVETYIIHKNRVLLRKHDKYKIWLSIGGHVELDEDPTQAALREVKEEVGLDVVLVGTIPETESTEQYQELLPPRYLNRHRISETHEHICLVYFARSESDQVMVGADGDRSDEWRWFSLEELDLPEYALKANVKFYAKEALSTV